MSDMLVILSEWLWDRSGIILKSVCSHLPDQFGIIFGIISESASDTRWKHHGNILGYFGDHFRDHCGIILETCSDQFGIIVAIICVLEGFLLDMALPKLPCITCVAKVSPSTLRTRMFCQ